MPASPWKGIRRKDTLVSILTEIGVAAVSAPMPAFWGVVRSLPQREKFASERLVDGGFEVFLPLVQTKRAFAPLFSGYFFVRIIDRWRAINTTFGVLCLVRVGDCPARCPDHEVANLKAMTDAHGYIKLPEGPGAPVRRKIAIGAAVKVTAGPFGGMSGLYAGQSTRERELILLNLLGRQTPVTIAAGQVVPIVAAALLTGGGYALRHSRLVCLGLPPSLRSVPMLSPATSARRGPWFR